MKVTINGTSKEFTNNLRLKDTILQFCKDSKHVIAELNGEIIKKARWEEVTLQDGDTVELVNFVGGG